MGGITGGGITPLFAIKGVRDYVQSFVDEVEQKTLDALSFIGEEFVNKARNTDTYKDRTRNLRGSIGYGIYKDGEPVRRNVNGQGSPQGSTEGTAYMDQIATQYPRGWVLIGVAGMEYAFFVEKNGYDVITGSAPTDSQLGELMQSILDSLFE